MPREGRASVVSSAREKNTGWELRDCMAWSDTQTPWSDTLEGRTVSRAPMQDNSYFPNSLHWVYLTHGTLSHLKDHPGGRWGTLGWMTWAPLTLRMEHPQVRGTESNLSPPWALLYWTTSYTNHSEAAPLTTTPGNIYLIQWIFNHLKKLNRMSMSFSQSCIFKTGVSKDIHQEAGLKHSSDFLIVPNI